MFTRIHTRTRVKVQSPTAEFQTASSSAQKTGVFDSELTASAGTLRDHARKSDAALFGAATCHLNAALTLSDVFSVAAVTSPPSLLSFLSIAANTCRFRTCGEHNKWLPGDDCGSKQYQRRNKHCIIVRTVIVVVIIITVQRVIHVIT